MPSAMTSIQVVSLGRVASFPSTVSVSGWLASGLSDSPP
jgi:hypothetical protein